MDTKMVRVRFFAALREQVGSGEKQVVAPAGATIADIWSLAVPGIALPENMLVACNQIYSRLDHPVAAGDEVAFLPPVTGG